MSHHSSYVRVHLFLIILICVGNQIIHTNGNPVKKIVSWYSQIHSKDNLPEIFVQEVDSDAQETTVEIVNTEKSKSNISTDSNLVEDYPGYFEQKQAKSNLYSNLNFDIEGDLKFFNSHKGPSSNIKCILKSVKKIIDSYKSKDKSTLSELENSTLSDEKEAEATEQDENSYGLYRKQQNSTNVGNKTITSDDVETNSSNINKPVDKVNNTDLKCNLTSKNVNISLYEYTGDMNSDSRAHLNENVEYRTYRTFETFLVDVAGEKFMKSEIKQVRNYLRRLRSTSYLPISTTAQVSANKTMNKQTIVTQTSSDMSTVQQNLSSKSNTTSSIH